MMATTCRTITVSTRHGTLGDFVQFTYACKQRSIRVLIDIVVNHTSDQHAWFQQARRDPGSSYRDWYVWAKENLPFQTAESCFPAYRDPPGPVTRSRPPGIPVKLRFPTRPGYVKPACAGGILKIWLQLWVSGFRMDAVAFVIASKCADHKQITEHCDVLRTFCKFLQWRKSSAIRRSPRAGGGKSVFTVTGDASWRAPAYCVIIGRASTRLRVDPAPRL